MSVRGGGGLARGGVLKEEVLEEGVLGEEGAQEEEEGERGGGRGPIFFSETGEGRLKPVGSLPREGERKMAVRRGERVRGAGLDGSSPRNEGVLGSSFSSSESSELSKVPNTLEAASASIAASTASLLDPGDAANRSKNPSCVRKIMVVRTGLALPSVQISVPGLCWHATQT